jgi:hypothetical protein
MRPVPDLPLVFTTEDLRRRGVSQEQADYRVRHRVWRRLQRGVYCSAATWEGASPEGRHLLAGLAMCRAAHGEQLVLSHVTAAVAHDLPVDLKALTTLTATSPPARKRANDSDRHIYFASLPPVDRTTHLGAPVTTVARTVADCLRHLPRGDAVAVADAALHQGLTTLDDVRAVLLRQERWPFAAVAALALPLVDGRRETRLESKSAVVMDLHNIPRPVPQLRILDPQRRFVARPDFVWVEYGVVGEADGRVKYENRAADVIQDEKDRQAKLEALGLVVVRWGERDLYGSEPVLVRRLNEAFERGDGRRFRGLAA